MDLFPSTRTDYVIFNDTNAAVQQPPVRPRDQLRDRPQRPDQGRPVRQRAAGQLAVPAPGAPTTRSRPRASSCDLAKAKAALAQVPGSARVLHDAVDRLACLRPTRLSRNIIQADLCEDRDQDPDPGAGREHRRDPVPGAELRHDAHVLDDGYSGSRRAGDLRRRLRRRASKAFYTGVQEPDHEEVRASAEQTLKHHHGAAPSCTTHSRRTVASRRTCPSCSPRRLTARQARASTAST